ncbi:MAG: prolyl-tRNA synthetase associated domain-containing protein [Pseudomonadota bacterium]|nr:prolyl-tRNA synthetase associated domain-containing protein [Pseudomonadota bacterium]
MIETTRTAPGMATPDDLFGRLDELGIKTQTHTHPPVFSVGESRTLRGTIPGQHCKTLFFKDKKGALWLCVVEEHRRMNMRVLSDLMGSARLSFARPERVQRHLGVEPGAVTPFALINDQSAKINVTLDIEVMAADMVNFHPLVNDRTTTISPQDLIRFIEACGHKPALLNFDRATVYNGENKEH